SVLYLSFYKLTSIATFYQLSSTAVLQYRYSSVTIFFASTQWPTCTSIVAIRRPLLSVAADRVSLIVIIMHPAFRCFPLCSPTAIAIPFLLKLCQSDSITGDHDFLVRRNDDDFNR